MNIKELWETMEKEEWWGVKVFWVGENPQRIDNPERATGKCIGAG